MENYSALSGGLWIIVLVLGLASIAGFIYLHFQRKSGTYFNDSYGKKHWRDSKPPLFSCWGFWVGSICGLATIVSLIVMYAAS